MPLKPVKMEAYQFRWEQRFYVSDSVRSRAEIIALCGMTLELKKIGITSGCDPLFFFSVLLFFINAILSAPATDYRAGLVIFVIS